MQKNIVISNGYNEDCPSIGITIHGGDEIYMEAEVDPPLGESFSR